VWRIRAWIIKLNYRYIDLNLFLYFGRVSLIRLPIVCMLV